MSRISANLYDFSKNLFKKMGLGNDKLLIFFGAATILSLLALVGFYVPSLITAINLILSLVICGTTFMAISLSSGLNPAAMFAGLVVGIIVGAIAFALSSTMLTIAPAVALLLAIPNIIAAGAYLLGGICSAIESCCSFCLGRNSQITNDSYSAPNAFEDRRYFNKESLDTKMNYPTELKSMAFVVRSERSEFNGPTSADWRTSGQQQWHSTMRGGIFPPAVLAIQEASTSPDFPRIMNR